MAIMKMNIEAFELKPNAGARKINNSGRTQPIIIHNMCFIT